MSSKKDLIRELKALVNEINNDIMELERTHYSEASNVYSKLEQLRFDKMPYLNKQGYFKSDSSQSKATLEKELKVLQKFKESKTLKVTDIQKSNKKRFETFNKQYKKQTGAKRGLTQKQYAKLRHDFQQWRTSNLSELITSDAVVQLSKKSTEKEIKDMIDFANENNERDTKKYIQDLANKHGVDLKK